MKQFNLINNDPLITNLKVKVDKLQILIDSLFQKAYNPIEIRAIRN